jgi:hypothetical protein
MRRRRRRGGVVDEVGYAPTMEVVVVGGASI